MIHGVVDKGMDYPDKIQLLAKMGYNDLVESFQLRYRNRHDGSEEEEDEEHFFAQLSFSVFRVGQWALELYQHQDKLLQSPQHLAAYHNIMQRLLATASNLLNTEKPKISRYQVEFLSFWLQAIKKQDILSDFDNECLLNLTRVVVERLTYPQWFTFKVDLSDYEEEFVKYRDELVINIFGNMALIKAYVPTLLQALAELLQRIAPGTTTAAQAEVILYLLYHLQSSIPSELREKATGDNPYCQLIQYLLKLDFLQFRHKAVNLQYLEVSVRYSGYLLKTEGFFHHIIGMLFSDHGLRSSDSNLASRSCYLLLRLCERFHSALGPESPELSLIDPIVANTVAVIRDFDQRKLGTLREEDINNLYNVLGLFVSSKNLGQQQKTQYLKEVYSQLSSKLSHFAGHFDKVLWTLKHLNIFSKGLVAAGDDEIYNQVLQQVLQAMNSAIGVAEICDQAMLYLQKCVSILGANVLPYVT